jgi:FkbM family methyltransferase
VPFRTRASLLAVALRRRLRPTPVYDIRFGRGSLPVTHEDYPVDWETVKSIVVDRIYELDYTDAVVLDIGSHKGYFGAFALERGARTVISLEPESANFRLLQRCAESYRGPRSDWRLRQVGVGALPGEAELHVMDASWGHTLEPPEEWAKYEVGIERVRIVPMTELLAEAEELAGETSPLVVKINAEGGECPMILGTTPESWARVSHVFVATHPWAACDERDLAAHLSRAGLDRRPNRGAGQILMMGR